MYSSDYTVIVEQSQSESSDSTSLLNPVVDSVVDKSLKRWNKAICMCIFSSMIYFFLLKPLIYIFLYRLLGNFFHCGNHYAANRIPIHLPILSSYDVPFLHGICLFSFICDLHCSGIILKIYFELNNTDKDIY